jgi:hypothetical protein
VSKFINKRRTAGIVAILAACIAGASAYAFTAGNIVPAHKSGAGSSVVSGYTVTGPSNYIYSADGTHVVGVTFTLSAAATDAAAALSAAAPVNADWVHCGLTGGGTIATCDYSGRPILATDALQLTVAAVSTGTVTIAP